MSVPTTPPFTPSPRSGPFPGGSPTSGGGGGTGTGSGSGGGVFVPTSNGGVQAASKAAFYPCQNLVSGNMEYFTFDALAVPNDPLNGSFYSWKVEQLMPFRSYTVRTIIWTFTDLGRVSVTWTLTGVDENQNVITQSASIGVGNAVPTGKIMSVQISLTQTGLNQQLSVTRLPNAGPMSIVQVVASIEVPESTL